MVKTKKKEEQVTKKESKVRIEDVFPETSGEASAQDEVVIARRQLWQDSIHELRSQEFSSMESAVDAVIDKVLEKAAATVEDKTDLKSFLSLLFVTDPEITEELEQVLRIKG